MSWPMDGKPRFVASGGRVLDRACCHRLVANFEPHEEGGRSWPEARRIAPVVAEWMERDGENALTLDLPSDARSMVLRELRGGTTYTKSERSELARRASAVRLAKRREQAA